jgi:hypothetical protein
MSRNIIFLALLALLLGFNIAQVVRSKNDKNAINKLKEAYWLKCQDEEITRSAFEKSIQYQGKTLRITNDSVKTILSNQTSMISLLFIKAPVCSTCIDVLMIELEKLRNDSIGTVNNLSVLIISEPNHLRKDLPFKIFQKKFNHVLHVGISEIENSNIEEFPSISYMMIDKQMKINSYCEFSEYYPAVFSSGLISINENFHQNF